MRISIKNVIAWALAFLMAFGFVIDAGLPKLLGAEAYVDVFAAFGYPLWFMYFIGLWETVAGIFLLLPRFAFYGAVALIVEMFGAALTHLVTGVGSPFHAVRAMLLLAILAWLRRPPYLRRADPNGQARSTGDEVLP